MPLPILIVKFHKASIRERRRDRVLARPNDTVIVELPLSVVARPGAPLAWPDTPPPVRIDLERRPT